jgi:uncharacterized OsmC-like protein
MVVFTGGVLNAQVDVLTAQYNVSRTSSNMQEQILTRANVNAAQFGKLFSRSLDAPFYASPLIVSNFNVPGVGTRNLVFVATLGNTVYAFDADDPSAANAYWSVNLGTPFTRSCCFLGPTIGILSTPVIDRSTNTIYLTAIVQASDVGLYVYALDLGTGALKFNSPRRITFTFPSGVTKTAADLPFQDTWLQRAGLLLVNNVLYVGTSAVWEGDTIFTQEGFIQTFKADDLSVQLASWETTPTSEGGGFWQAGRGIAADSSGNVFAAVNSGAYNPPSSFGNSIVKFSPGTLTPADWFTPANWSFLWANDLDVSANGVTLIPGTSLAFTGGKVGVIYLLDQTNLGKLEPGSGNSPLQQFQASQGCGTAQCGQHLATAFWPHASAPSLYVWDLYDSLRAYPFDTFSQRFLTGNATVGSLRPSRAGGMTISSNGSTDGTGIVWATTAAQDPLTTRVPGTLHAYNSSAIPQELYSSDQNSCRDSLGIFVKMSTPIVANGKVYVNTQSNVLPVYGLLSSLPPTSPPPGTVHVTVNASLAGPAIIVDGNTPCTGPAEFDWIPGSQHTIATYSPQGGTPGNAPQAGTPGVQFVWNGWSDSGALSHTVAPASAATYTANFTTQYLLMSGVSPEAAGGIAASPLSNSGYYNAGAGVQLTATPIAGCSFVNWSGALTGSANPQTVTMSAPQTVTANFQCGIAPPSSFVTGYSHKVLRNDFTGWVGMQFTVGNSALSVSALGRVSVYGNTGTHTVKLVNIDGTDVAGGAVSIPAIGGAAGKVNYTALASPVTLQANTAYYLLSQEVDGGDQWYDFAPLSTTSAAAVTNSLFSFAGTVWQRIGDPDTSYGPVSFQYTSVLQYPLTTSVLPAGSGSVVTNPSPAGGLYNSGASAQLTATPLAGCTFLNWTGALTGAANPQTVTMSGPQTVTANFQCDVPPATNFLTGYALNAPPLRNDFGGWVGMKLTVGPNPLALSSLGRICIAGNGQTHTVKFVGASDGSDVLGASASVNMAGCTAGQFVYGTVNGVTLTAGASYYLVSQESYGGDRWYDFGKVASTAAAAVNSSVYYYSGNWIPINPGKTSYVPPNFQYAVVTQTQYQLTSSVSPASGGSIAANPSSPSGYYNTGTPVQLTAAAAAGCTFVNWSGALSGNGNPQTVTMTSSQAVTANFQCSGTTAASFVTGYALSAPPLRNDFGGWVGMKLTVGSSPLAVSSLGRICVSGNTQTHAVKIVNASDGSDVPGATVALNMAGCAAGQFVYGAVNGVTMAAGASYYLASQEAQGGDRWYDQGAISATNAAAVSSAVYFYGGNWIPIGASNTSYVPPNFQYAVMAPQTQYLLSTSVSPAGGGSIAASPASAGGYYNSGTPVQLTATAAAGCTFVNWSGALTGAVNPQTVTMSSAQTVSANFQCITPPASGFVTGFALNGPSLRNDFTGWVGMKLTVGVNPLAVSALGRICVAGNALTHTVKLVNVSDGSDVSGASAPVNMVGCTPGQFTYATVSPGNLPAGASYYLVSQETQGGDRWYDQGAISVANAAAVNSSVYFYGGNWIPVGSGNASYVPPSFQYAVVTQTQYQLTSNVSPAGGGSIAANPAAAGGYYNSGAAVQLTATAATGCAFANWSGALSGSANPQTVTMTAAQTVTANFQCTTLPSTSFLTGYALNGPSLRNDFGGWVGMKLTVGASPLTVSSLGRICVAGNSQTHAVKFVNAGDGSDVAGASATIGMAGCTPGQFVYGAVSSINLPVGASYYLVSQEVSGGDRWYDFGAVSATNAAAVNSAVYFYGGNWIPVASANTSYVPPNFQYR